MDPSLLRVRPIGAQCKRAVLRCMIRQRMRVLDEWPGDETLLRCPKTKAWRIAANIAKLPELLR